MEFLTFDHLDRVFITVFLPPLTQLSCLSVNTLYTMRKLKMVCGKYRL